MRRAKLPDGRRFAFTVFDDTDQATLDNVRPVYELLQRLGMKTTKSVWVFPADDPGNPHYRSHTLQDEGYMEFIERLNGAGFEIAFHNASPGSSERETTISALEHFRKKLGYYPRAHVNHESNRENLYWGHERLDSPLLRPLMRLRGRQVSQGHRPGSPFFWGDVCQRRILYVRNFVFREINLMRINPTMPYKDPNRPFVRYWFSSSEGGSVKSFNELISMKNQERLEREGGVCIAYTHFASGFVKDGMVDPLTEELLTAMSERGGWFVPVSTLLDHLRAQSDTLHRPWTERVNMELRWALTKLVYGRA